MLVQIMPQYMMFLLAVAHVVLSIGCVSTNFATGGSFLAVILDNVNGRNVSYRPIYRRSIRERYHRSDRFSSHSLRFVCDTRFPSAEQYESFILPLLSKVSTTQIQRRCN